LLVQPGVDPKSPSFYLSAPDVLRFVASSGTSGGSDDTLARVLRLAYQARGFKSNDLTAFEENRFFVYAVGSVSEPHGDLGENRPNHRLEPVRLTRRLIFLKPSTFVVDDEVETPSVESPQWRLYSRFKPAFSGDVALITQDGSELTCETMLPNRATRQVKRRPGDSEGIDGYVLDVRPEKPSRSLRFFHVLQARRHGAGVPVASTQLATQDGHPQLTIKTDHHIFSLTLPPVQTGAGDIEISRNDGKALLSRRLLPSGKLPHGVKGVRLLEQWDADYRGKQPPLWDVGRPSGDLIKAVESGTLRPGRVVELGCGSGTDAVYLAGRGFDVTAIDIAPTALRLAQEKAVKAGVRVRWLLADVLALPSLEPFDFIYDRGCYHEVRAQNLKAYLEALARLSRPGTRFLLLAGNANEVLIDYGPPRVTEQELRGDFSALFDFEWLRESRFEIARPRAIGPLAWAALLRRKAEP
jgi:SAM-dependent methyltransferase